MYRIHFDYKTAQFVVQVVVLGLIWRNAQDMAYKTYDEALKAVSNIGLDKLYANRSDDQYRVHMSRVV